LPHKIHKNAHEHGASENDQSKPEQFGCQRLGCTRDRVPELIDNQVKRIADHLRLDNPEIIHQEDKKNTG
jgi:hypothetical protein